MTPSPTTTWTSPDRRPEPSHSALLVGSARELRLRATPSEEALWSLPAAGRSESRSVAGFIADFAAPSTRLIVEVDGGCHERRRGADASRDRKLARAGYRVLRLRAELVLAEPETALALVRQALGPR